MWPKAFRQPWYRKRYATDKIDNGFLPHYERILGSLRSKPVCLMELGVAEGGSCLLWEDFFRHPKTTIVGLDVKLPNMPKASKDWRNTVLERCDQRDEQGLNEIAQRYGPFDVIIDDASHQYEASRTSFRTLLPHLKSGGFYVIEDWSIGYFEEAHDTYADEEGNTTVTLVTEILGDASSLGLCSAEVILDIYRSIAFFRKNPPGIELPLFGA